MRGDLPGGGDPLNAIEFTGAAREAVDGALCRMRLERGDRVGAVWCSPAVCAIVVPRDGKPEVSSFPTLFLPDARARVTDLGPRLRIEPARTIALSPGELAEAIATRTSADELLQSTLDGFREHWRIESRWTPSPESAGVRVVEVVDTDAGLWSVVPDGSTVELWPTTPTNVFRALAGLLPRDHEMGAPA